MNTGEIHSDGHRHDTERYRQMMNMTKREQIQPDTEYDKTGTDTARYRIRQKGNRYRQMMNMTIQEQIQPDTE
jgi:hypothetical protein